jgi:hypothetical protein
MAPPIQQHIHIAGVKKLDIESSKGKRLMVLRLAIICRLMPRPGNVNTEMKIP